MWVWWHVNAAWFFGSGSSTKMGLQKEWVPAQQHRALKIWKYLGMHWRLIVSHPLIYIWILCPFMPTNVHILHFFASGFWPCILGLSNNLSIRIVLWGKKKWTREYFGNGSSMNVLWVSLINCSKRKVRTRGKKSGKRAITGNWTHDTYKTKLHKESIISDG